MRPSLFNRFALILFVFIIILELFGCRSVPTEAPINTPISPTVASPTETETLPPPTPSHTPSPIPPTATPTIAPSQTEPPPTPTSTSTATEEPATLTLKYDSVCRQGPEISYSIEAFLSEGDVVALVGQLEDNQPWWLIQSPEGEAQCWIAEGDVTLQGSLAAVPRVTPPPTPYVSPTPEEELGGMRYYLIALETGGPFGCGDGLVYFASGRKSTGGAENGIKVALQALFDLKQEYVGNFYNPLYQSNLHVESVSIAAGGHTTIKVRGSFVKPKSECDALRMQDQVYQTVTQFSEVSGRPRILINGKEFGDLLQSIQGE